MVPTVGQQDARPAQCHPGRARREALPTGLSMQLFAVWVARKRGGGDRADECEPAAVGARPWPSAAPCPCRRRRCRQRRRPQLRLVGRSSIVRGSRRASERVRTAATRQREESRPRHQGSPVRPLRGLAGAQTCRATLAFAAAEGSDIIPRRWKARETLYAPQVGWGSRFDEERTFSLLSLYEEWTQARLYMLRHSHHI